MKFTVFWEDWIGKWKTPIMWLQRILLPKKNFVKDSFCEKEAGLRSRPLTISIRTLLIFPVARYFSSLKQNMCQLDQAFCFFRHSWGCRFWRVGEHLRESISVFKVYDQKSVRMPRLLSLQHMFHFSQDKSLDIVVELLWSVDTPLLKHPRLRVWSLSWLVFQSRGSARKWRSYNIARHRDRFLQLKNTEIIICQPGSQWYSNRSHSKGKVIPFCWCICHLLLWKQASEMKLKLSQLESRIPKY